MILVLIEIRHEEQTEFIDLKREIIICNLYVLLKQIIRDIFWNY